MTRPSASVSLLCAVLLAGPAAAHAARAAPLPPPVPPTGAPGTVDGACAADEKGPALVVDVVGLKDRRGLIKLEVYPPVEGEFLGTDRDLVAQGKTFRRTEMKTPASGPVALCVRVPEPGTYSAVVLHDRDSNHKFGWSVDGVGFPGNPRIGWGAPKAAAARVTVGHGITRISVVMNYFRGFGMGPVRSAEGQ